MTVKNGQIPLDRLTLVDGFRFRDDAGNSFKRLAAAYLKANGHKLELTGAYRPYSVQVDIFLDRYRPMSVGVGPYGDVRWWNKRRYVRRAGTAAAAIPGESNHGLGVAVDLSTRIGFGRWDSKAYKWMAANAPAYGWDNLAGRSINEPWHWEYKRANDTKRPQPSKKLKVDGDLGPATFGEWQEQLGNLTPDKVFGPKSVARLRVRLNGKNGHGGYHLSGGKLDGGEYLTGRDIKAVQKLLNVWDERGLIELNSGPLKVDGIIGPRTVKALQKSLNEGLWE